MSVTLEQYRVLREQLDNSPLNIDQRSLLNWLQITRSNGVRVENTLKNTGKIGFAFNALQRSCLPEILRPPSYACVKNES